MQFFFVLHEKDFLSLNAVGSLEYWPAMIEMAAKRMAASPPSTNQEYLKKLLA